jgi:hypothetical protein
MRCAHQCHPTVLDVDGTPADRRNADRPALNAA